MAPMSLVRAFRRQGCGAPSAAALVACCAIVLGGCGQAVKSESSAEGSPAARAAADAAATRTHVPEADWLRFDYDAQRSGVGPVATGITAHNLRALRLRTVRLPGTVDSSSIELHAVNVDGRTRDMIVMTTTYGRTIALDPGTGRQLWEFTPADIGSYQGSAQITTATPIADPDRRYVYAASPDGRIHKLVLASGREVRSGGWPISVTFDPTHEKIASALNISGDSLIITTGGYVGDIPPYQGHVVTISLASGRITAVWNALCSDRHSLIDPPSSCPASDAAIWAREGAVVEPGTGRLLVVTGNAPFNGSTEWGDSVLELSPDGSRLLHNWTPTDQAQLNADDLDLGSTAPALLPVFHGRRLAVQGGKAGVVDLLDLDRLDGTAGGPGPRTGGQLQQVAAPGSTDVYTAPAVWTHAGRTYVFVATNAATWAYVLAGSGANPRLSVAWRSGDGGTSPVIAGGLLYVYDPSGSLDVYQPASGRKLVSLPAGSGHWNSPIVVGGRVILPVGNANDHATSGTLDIYHLPGR
jgi:PQQ-like domain